MKDTTFGKIDRKVDPEDLATLIASRRSVRRFTTKPLDKETILQLLQAAANAPQAKNSRMQGYAVVTDREKIRAMDRAVVGAYQKLLKIPRSLLAVLKLLIPGKIKQLQKNRPSLERLVTRSGEGNYPIFHDAPCAVIIHGPSDNMLARDDAAIAEQNMLLQAHAMGLGGCIIGYASVKSKPLLKYISLPKGHAIQAVVVFGHPEKSFSKSINRPVENTRWYQNRL